MSLREPGPAEVVGVLVVGAAVAVGLVWSIAAAVVDAVRWLVG